MKRWEILREGRVERGELRNEDITDVLLNNRGLKTKKEREDFLNPKLEDVNFKNVGIDVKEVEKTAKRIKSAIKNNEKIIIYGDYDVDGICGTAILWETLFGIYKNVMPHIPHRVEEGYGLSIKGIDHVLKEFKEVGLIITVDNGIVANDAVTYAKELGIDVIITDHHVSSETKPDAYAIVHTTKLCGAGVAYLLSQEIRNSLFAVRKNDKRQTTNDKHNTHLELAALATVADLVPLVGANRTIVKFGIENLKSTKRPGLLALFENAQIKKVEMDVYKIGHVIAPRLNASGRIAHAMDSLRLICTKDPLRAKMLAQELSITNRERQLMTEESTLHADSITIDPKSDKIIFVHSVDYNPGIIGLVASRLVEKHYRPSFAVSVGDQVSKGSARSVAGFNIIEFLRTHSSHLIDAGGHPMAAGFTIETPRIEEFKQALLESSRSIISEQILERVLKVDLELSFDQINSELYFEIQKLAPFGMGNFEPVFVSKSIRVENTRTVGQDGKHLKLSLSQGGEVFDAIYFKGADQGLKIGDTIDAAYTIEQDSWNGNQQMQLKVKDVKLI